MASFHNAAGVYLSSGETQSNITSLLGVMRVSIVSPLSYIVIHSSHCSATLMPSCSVDVSLVIVMTVEQRKNVHRTF
jgi:hypothetical protein